jgi:putative transposase
VDTLGLLLLVVVHPANIADVTAAQTVFTRLKPLMHRLVLIWADRGYEGLEGWLIAHCGWVLHIVKPPQGTKGFTLLPRRWVVERSFAWFGRYRRLSKDYEFLPQSSEAWIYMASSFLILKRLVAT